MHNKCVAYVTAEFILTICSIYILPRVAEVLVILMTLRQGEKMTGEVPHIAQILPPGTMSGFPAINPWE